MSATTCLQRETRLNNGWDVIARAEAAGEDVTKLEAFWLQLLASYCAKCAVAEDDISPIAHRKGVLMGIELTCRSCRQLFEPSKDDLRKGPAHYRVCPDCRVSASQSTCSECGRVLHGTSRRICLNCLGAAA